MTRATQGRVNSVFLNHPSLKEAQYCLCLAIVLVRRTVRPPLREYCRRLLYLRQLNMEDNSSTALDVLGMPSDVLLHLLGHLHNARVVMRLGISNRKLLAWIDSQDAFWAPVYEKSGFDVSAASAARPSQKIRLGHQAIRNIEEPFNSVHTLFKTHHAEDIISLYMQNGAATILGVVSAAKANQSVVLLDVARWPDYSISTLKPRYFTTPFGAGQLHLVGCRKAVRFQTNILNQHYATDVFIVKSDSSEIVFDRRIQPTAELGKYISVASSDSRMPRIAYVHVDLARVLAIVYDVDANRWSELVSVNKDWNETDEEIREALFNGDCLVCHFVNDVIIIRFDKQTMEHSVIYNGSFPSRVPGTTSMALSRDHLIICYPLEYLPLPDEEVKSRMGRVSLDEIERSSSIWGPEFASLSFDAPVESSCCQIVAHGTLAILYCDGRACIVDFDQRKIIRSFQIDLSHASSPQFAFVDSTMFAVITSNSVVVVDMLSRRTPLESEEGSLADSKTSFISFSNHHQPKTTCDIL